MLENKKLNMVISLVIAIALWAFVIGEVNPQATRIYRDVPIKFLNEESLTERGLAVYAVSDETLNVTLSGTRSEINQIDSKDITASVDLEEADSFGENRLKVQLRVSNKVEIESQSLEAITVSLDEKTTKEVGVSVYYKGTFEDDQEPITIDQSLDTVVVSGAEVIVEKVDAAKAVVEENTVTEEERSLQCALVAVNKAGHTVTGVELSVDEITVTAELAMVKTVPLELSVLNQNAGGITRLLTAPEQITLKGRKSDLEQIQSIEAEPIDIGDIQTDTKLDIVPILPEGVEVSEHTDVLTLSISVVAAESRTLQISSDQIQLTGLADGQTAEILSKGISVIVTGPKEYVEGLQSDQIRVTADLNGLKTGKHKAALSATLANAQEGVTVKVQPKEIKIAIKDGTKVDESDTGNNQNQNEADGNQESSGEADQTDSEESEDQGGEE